MENGKKVAYPIVGMAFNENAKGLTKREYFAGLAMQGLLSANAMYNGKTDERALISQDAIAHADELLKQLEK